jgi:hypothetical protein
MADISLEIADGGGVTVEAQTTSVVVGQSLLDPAITLEVTSQPAVVEMVLPRAIAVELGFTYTGTAEPGGGVEAPPESGTIVRVDGVITSVVMESKTITLNRANGYIESISDGTTTWTFLRDENNAITGWEVTS